MAAAADGGGVMDACLLARNAGLVAELLGTVDCKVGQLSQLGYQLLAGDGQFAYALTALLTIYVAIIGLRLMLGFGALRIGELTVTALKIGLVVTLATNWPAYQQTIFAGLFHGPEEIASLLLRAGGSAHLGGSPFAALQATFDEFQASAAFFSRAGAFGASSLVGGVPFAAVALNLASYLVLFSSLGALVAAKIVLGILLALAPLFAGLLLFDATRGLFAGWLKASLLFAMLPLLVTLGLSVQLLLVDPYVTALAAMRADGRPDLALANTALVLSFIGPLVSLMGLLAVWLVARGLKLSWRTQPIAASAETTGTTPALAEKERQVQTATARAILTAIERRDSHASRTMVATGGFARLQTEAAAAAPSYFSSVYRRSAQPSERASARRRDRE
jgi:type IV secretion system protein VirB6